MELILNDVRSIQNVATCFRSADGIGVSKIWMCGYTPGPLDKYGIVIPKFSRIALGAENSISWESERICGELIEELKEDGKVIVAVETGSLAEDYAEIDIEADFEDVVLVMGSETDGLSDDILEACDHVIEIPMHGEKESLNVAVAFSVAGFVVRDFLCD